MTTNLRLRLARAVAPTKALVAVVTTGTRITTPDGNAEWDGSAWLPVCPVDDVAMTDTDDDGWVSCPRCGRTAA